MRQYLPTLKTLETIRAVVIADMIKRPVYMCNEVSDYETSEARNQFEMNIRAFGHNLSGAYFFTLIDLLLGEEFVGNLESKLYCFYMNQCRLQMLEVMIHLRKQNRKAKPGFQHKLSKAKLLRIQSSIASGFYTYICNSALHNFGKEFEGEIHSVLQQCGVALSGSHFEKKCDRSNSDFYQNLGYEKQAVAKRIRRLMLLQMLINTATVE